VQKWGKVIKEKKDVDRTEKFYERDNFMLRFIQGFFYPTPNYI
jgi:hypothetical protein